MLPDFTSEQIQAVANDKHLEGSTSLAPKSEQTARFSQQQQPETFITNSNVSEDSPATNHNKRSAAASSSGTEQQQQQQQEQQQHKQQVQQQPQEQQDVRDSRSKSCRAWRYGTGLASSRCRALAVDRSSSLAQGVF
jgi:hypothetical protein